MQTLPVPSMILSTRVLEIISVLSILETQLETSFKAEISVKAFCNCSNNFAFKG